MSDREKFEAWAKLFYQEQQMSRNSENHYARPNEYMMPNYQAAYEGWQAATAEQDKTIAELNARIAELEADRNRLDAKIGQDSYDSGYAQAKLDSSDTIAELVEALELCVEANTWELGGEPIDTLMLEASKKAKSALAKAKQVKE